MAGGGRTDRQVMREIGKQAHGGEFGGTDGKAAHGKREMNQIGMGMTGQRHA